MLPRLLAPRLTEALARRPVVLVVGPRQSGKTTLVREHVRAAGEFEYVTLDDATSLAAALRDPEGFLAAHDGAVAVDEVQHAPGLLRAIKASVDRDRRPGRFLLTGSADVLALPAASESLAGRMEILRLHPLAQAERGRVPGGFVDRLFDADAGWSWSRRLRGEPPAATWDRVVRGGFPEPLGIDDARSRAAWFRSYETSVVQRDLRDVAQVEDVAAIPRLLRVLAARTARPANFADVARDASLNHMTLRRYVAHLRALFLVGEIPAWATNAAKRYAKAPKVLVSDSGFAAFLLHASAERLRTDAAVRGPLVETFAAAEIAKLSETSDAAPALHHYRTHAGREVDVVLEDGHGRIVGIEVTSASSVSPSDLAGLESLAEDAGKRFVRGVVLHAGPAATPFDARFAALPITALWT